MRQVWVLSEDSRVPSRLSAAFVESRFHVKYRVQLARSISDVPESHLNDPGVSFFVDAFSTEHPGFGGLKKLRELGFKGPVLLLGEPAPEDAVNPFIQDQLTAFLPPVDRCDMSMAAGILHCFHNFEGHLDLKWFLDGGGKSATEAITHIKDFNQLVQKMVSFVSRFGVNIQKLKRALVALSSSYVQTGAQGPNVTQPFTLVYGMDANKLIVGVSIDATQIQDGQFLQDFGAALSQVKASGAGPAIRSDILNVTKITSNLVYIGGGVSQEPAEQSYLLTTLEFPQPGKDVTLEPYFFSYVVATQSAELQDSLSAVPDLAPITEPAQEPSQEPAPVVTKKTLFEPQITGDDADLDTEEAFEVQKPTVVLAPAHPRSSAAQPGESEEEVPTSSPEMMAKYREMEEELVKHKSLSEALAADVKRLMKERRVPLTNADLKASLDELNVRLKFLQEQNKKLTEVGAQKDGQLELLKAQVDRLKVNAA